MKLKKHSRWLFTNGVYVCRLQPYVCKIRIESQWKYIPIVEYTRILHNTRSNVRLQRLSLSETNQSNRQIKFS